MINTVIIRQEDVGEGAYVEADVPFDDFNSLAALFRLLQGFEIIYLQASYGHSSEFFPHAGQSRANCLKMKFYVGPRKVLHHLSNES
jgi:hypothetical protein